MAIFNGKIHYKWSFSIATQSNGFVWKCWVNIPNEIAIFQNGIVWSAKPLGFGGLANMFRPTYLKELRRRREIEETDLRAWDQRPAVILMIWGIGFWLMVNRFLHGTFNGIYLTLIVLSDVYIYIYYTDVI